MAQIIGTGVQVAGKNARISVGGTSLTQSKGNVQYEGVDLDTMNFNSAGFQEGILGPIGLKWSFGGNWDAGTNPLSNPPGLYPRDDLAALLIYTNVSAAQYFNMPYARVRSSTVGIDVKGVVTFDASGMSQGTFSTPTGNVS